MEDRHREGLLPWMQGSHLSSKHHFHSPPPPPRIVILLRTQRTSSVAPWSLSGHDQQCRWCKVMDLISNFPFQHIGHRSPRGKGYLSMWGLLHFHQPLAQQPTFRERERMSWIAKIIYTWSCSLVSGEKGDAFLLIYQSTGPLSQVYGVENQSFLWGVFVKLNLYFPNLMLWCLAAPRLLWMWRIEQQSKKDVWAKWTKRRKVQQSLRKLEEGTPRLDMLLLMPPPSCATVFCLLDGNKAAQILQTDCMLYNYAIWAP